MNDIQGMLIFSKVIEAGSFSKAAKQLNIAKSTVSKKINALEKQLGIILIQRSTRQLHITDEGWLVYQQCQTITEALRQAQQVAVQAQETPQGLLRITAPPLARYLLTPLLPDFQQHHPEVSVELLLTEDYSDVIRDGYDISIRMGELPDSDLIQQLLCRIEIVCFASPEYIKNNTAPQRPSELTDHRCIVWQPYKRKPMSVWELTKGSVSQRVQIRGSVIVNDSVAMKKIALNHGGIAMLPTLMIQQELESGKLVRVLPDYLGPTTPAHILYPRKDNLPAKTRAFIKFIRQQKSIKFHK